MFAQNGILSEEIEFKGLSLHDSEIEFTVFQRNIFGKINKKIWKKVWRIIFSG